RSTAVSHSGFKRFSFSILIPIHSASRRARGAGAVGALGLDGEGGTQPGQALYPLSLYTHARNIPEQQTPDIVHRKPLSAAPSPNIVNRKPFSVVFDCSIQLPPLVLIMGSKRTEWGIAMAGRPLDFRHHDVVRALKAVRAAGIDSPSLRIRTPGGTEYHFGGEVKGRGVPKVRGKTSTSVRDPDAASKGSSPGSQNASLAEGGSSQGMVKRQAADPAPSGRTAKTKSVAAPKEAIGGLARPCKPA